MAREGFSRSSTIAKFVTPEPGFLSTRLVGRLPNHDVWPECAVRFHFATVLQFGRPSPLRSRPIQGDSDQGTAQGTHATTIKGSIGTTKGTSRTSPNAVRGNFFFL